MSNNVDLEEAAAIWALSQEEPRENTAAEVVGRDFRQPRRFSGQALGAFRDRVEHGLPELDKALKTLFKVPLRVTVEDMREVSAEGLFDGLTKPFALAAFEVASQPAWILWNPLAAVQAIEKLLGSSSGSQARELSDIERRFLKQVFTTVVEHATRALGIKPSVPVLVQSVEDIADWRDGGDKAEPHRLIASLCIEGLGDTSRFHLYLPGFQDGSPANVSKAEELVLPAHLGSVAIELGAHLGASDVPLDDLLGLEIGDVISLGTLIGAPLVLRVEGVPWGTAELGSLKGNRAVRILGNDLRSEDNV